MKKSDLYQVDREEKEGDRRKGRTARRKYKEGRVGKRNGREILGKPCKMKDEYATGRLQGDNKGVVFPSTKANFFTPSLNHTTSHPSHLTSDINTQHYL